RGLSVQVQGLGDLVADRVQRAQRGHRLLENDRYAAALELAHRTAARAQLRNVAWRRGRERIEEPDAATGNARNAGQDSHDALADDGLARTRLSHQSYGATLRDAEADAIDRLEQAFRKREMDLEILDLKHVTGHGPSPCRRTMSAIRSTLARVMGLSASCCRSAAATAACTSCGKPSRLLATRNRA